jgi:hypothetical protein
MKTLFTIISLTLFGTLVTQKASATDYSFGPSLSFGGRFSDEVQEFTGDFLQPVYQRYDQVMLLNLRGFAVEDKAQEYNFGFVYRILRAKPDVVLGVNAYYDGRNTEENNYFSQLGFGAEMLFPWVDLRANAYLPIGDDSKGVRSFSQEQVSQTRSATQLITTTTTTQYRVFEEALEGYDVEAGVLLPVLADCFPTRVFAGYYVFSSDVVEDIEGFRARLESRLHPLLTLDAEWYEDDELNGTDYFVGFRLNVPLGGGGKRREGLGTRLNQPVYRDFHIRTSLTPPLVTSTTVAQEVTDIPEPEPEPTDDEPTPEIPDLLPPPLG